MPLSRLVVSSCRLVLTLLLVSAPAVAHETDQFTVPPNRQYADSGPLLSRWMYDAVKGGVDKVNAKIQSALASNDRSALARLHTDEEIVPAVNGSLPWAMDVIEGWEKRLGERQLWDRYPGKVLIYQDHFMNIYHNVYFPLDPRQIMRIWNSGTFLAFGTYMGTDKIGHFTDMGMNYWREYDKARKSGASPEEAQKKAVGLGTDGLIFSERGLLGYLTAGSYSNGDLSANFIGYLFYRNLTEPMPIKGRTHPPLLVRNGEFWRISPNVNPDLFLADYISDHLDEALNPSHYESDMRPHVRARIAERISIDLEHYADDNGQHRPRAWFAKKHEQLKTYYGMDYGNYGPPGELLCLADIAFPPATGRAVDARDAVGRMPIHRVALDGDVAGIRDQLAHGANPNAPIRSDERYDSDWGSTPLHLAARSGSVEAAQLLISAGANVNAKNDLGVTPLHCAADSHNPELVALLLSRGASVNVADARGRTPLHWAAIDREQGARIAAVLLENRADPNARNRENRTPMHEAAIAFNSPAVDTLLARGARPDAADRFGVTPLHLAAARDDLRSVSLLTSRGTNPNTRDDFGATPLHEASRNHASQAVAMLLRSGADSSLADAYGQHPVDLARAANDRAVVVLLTDQSLSGQARTAGGRTTPNRK